MGNPGGLPKITVELLVRVTKAAPHLWHPGCPPCKARVLCYGHLVTQSWRCLQSAPGRPGSAVAAHRVLHLPVLPLPAHGHAAAAAGGAGRGGEGRLGRPVASPRAD